MSSNTVVIKALSGSSYLKNVDGSKTALHQGMRVPIDAHIVNADNSSLVLQADG